MSLSNISAGRDLPREFHVIVEIPMHGDPIKYEVDKDTGAIFVDRFMSTAMRYPCNYGYIPQTLAADGDPVDVLVIAPCALPPGIALTCRPLGLLQMQDEHGQDNKILAVPVSRLTRLYDSMRGPQDLGAPLLDQIAHFFSHYKDLEEGKFVRVGAYASALEAMNEITGAAQAYLANTAASS